MKKQDDPVFWYKLLEIVCLYCEYFNCGNLADSLWNLITKFSTLMLVLVSIICNAIINMHRN